MNLSPKRLFQTLLLLSLTLNVGLLTVWLITPSGPLTQLEESESQWRQCAYQQQLELTDKQLQRLMTLRQDFQTSQYDHCKYVQSERLELLEHLEASETTPEAIEDQRARILSKQEEMLDMVVERLVAEREILDDDQRSQWFEYLRSRVQCPDPLMSGGEHKADARKGAAPL